MKLHFLAIALLAIAVIPADGYSLVPLKNLGHPQAAKRMSRLVMEEEPPPFTKGISPVLGGGRFSTDAPDPNAKVLKAGSAVALYAKLGTCNANAAPRTNAQRSHDLESHHIAAAWWVLLLSVVPSFRTLSRELRSRSRLLSRAWIRFPMARRSHARRRQALLCRPSRRWLERRPFAFCRRFGGYLHRPLSYVGLQIRSHRRMLACNCSGLELFESGEVPVRTRTPLT
jgi:hypothetical protein